MKKQWHFTRLSAVQIKSLCTLAGKAQKAAKLRGDDRADVPAEEWRKAGQDEATGERGLSLRDDATQVHYLPIRGHWFVIIGNLEAAFYSFLNAGPQNEAARQMKWRLAGEVSRLAEGIQTEKAGRELPVLIDDATAASEAWNYTRALAVDKFGGLSINGLDAGQLEQLCHTVFNRASAKLGVGDPSRRNKKQQRPTRRKATPADAPAEEPARRSLPALPVVTREIVAA